MLLHRETCLRRAAIGGERSVKEERPEVSPWTSKEGAEPLSPDLGPQSPGRSNLCLLWEAEYKEQ